MNKPITHDFLNGMLHGIATVEAWDGKDDPYVKELIEKAHDKFDELEAEFKAEKAEAENKKEWYPSHDFPHQSSSGRDWNF